MPRMWLVVRQKSTRQSTRCFQQFWLIPLGLNPGVGGVKVTDIVESKAPVQKRYEPSNPLADKDGYVYMTNVNLVEEMADMISASRSYQNNVEIMNTAKQMYLSTLKLGQ